MPRSEIKVYEYTLDGKFIKEWNSMSEVRKHHYPNDKGKRPLFPFTKNYNSVPNGNYICLERIGREGIIEIEKSKKQIVIKHKQKRVILKNKNNEFLASFANEAIASQLLNIPRKTIFNRLRVTKNASDGIVWKHE
jgi:hypothetical protein